MEQRVTAMASKIPKRLHFVWGLINESKEIPQIYRKYYEKWIDSHPQWDVRLLGRETINRIAEDYKQYPFESYSKDIQRCDACRPMLLHKFGGVYSDIDVEPHDALDRLLSAYPHANVFLVVETILPKEIGRQIGLSEPIRKGVPELPVRIANYFMASVPGHPFWLEVLELMNRRHHLPIRNEYDVLFTTGPDVVTEVAHRAVHCYSDVVVVPLHIISQIVTHHRAGGWRDEQCQPHLSGPV